MDLTKQDIMQYLRTVGLLEWNIYDINNDIADLENERQQLFMKRGFERQQFYPLSFCVKSFLKSFLISSLIGIIVYVIWITATSNLLQWVFPALNDIPNDDKSVSAIKLILNCLWYVPPIILTLFLVRRSKGWKLLYGFFISKKNNIVGSVNFTKQESQRLKNAPNQASDLEYQVACLTDLVNRMNHELQQVYDLNIIHSKYRNLQAISTLYEYFEAGTADTLKEALNKYDNESRLDGVSAQLDVLNRNMQNIYNEILYQSKLTEQNNKLAQQQLEYARVTTDISRQIEINTKITAFNTSVLRLLEERKSYY